MADGRWPSSVFDEGEEPDYRFSLANERTFLAWIRTALALLAGSVALTGLSLDISETLAKVLAVVLALLSISCAVTGWLRWARIERAMRRKLPLPSVGPVLFAVSFVVVGAVIFSLWR
jgi:putative membrane protein